MELRLCKCVGKVEALLANSLENLRQGQEVLLDPGAEVVALRDGLFKFSIIDNATSDSIDQQHLAGLQTALLDNAFGVNRDGTDFGRADDAGPSQGSIIHAAHS